MTQALTTTQPSAEMLEAVLLEGDLSKMTPAQRVEYSLRLCESLGINPLGKPFEYIRLNGKLVLYATRNCSDQLRSTRNINVAITSRERVDDVYVVTARASTPDGRSDESIGAVPFGGVKGEALANALMKAETKAKRRVTLSFCGLSWADETEVGSIPGAQAVTVDAETGEILHEAPALAAPAEALISKAQLSELERQRQRLGWEPSALVAWIAAEYERSPRQLTATRAAEAINRLAWIPADDNDAAETETVGHWER